MSSSTIKAKFTGQKHGPITRLVSPSDLGQILKPFVFLDLFETELSMAMGGGFPWHPHSGIATISIVVEGESWVEETDQVRHPLFPGDIEWVMAGNGVWHTGGSAGKSKLQGVQLWLALPPELENTQASAAYIKANDINHVGPARVIVGPYNGVTSPVPAPAHMTVLDVSLAAGESWTYQPSEEQSTTWLAPIAGKALVNAEATINKGEVLILEEGTANVVIQAQSSMRFVIASAKPHPHELIMGPYSVHTNRQALQQGHQHIANLAEDLRRKGLI
jgi:redox-sensitive bicupin YhaK (pirin superfamily)